MMKLARLLAIFAIVFGMVLPGCCKKECHKKDKTEKKEKKSKKHKKEKKEKKRHKKHKKDKKGADEEFDFNK